MRPDKAYLPDVKALKRGQCEPCLVPAVANAVAECLGVPPAEEGGGEGDDREREGVLSAALVYTSNRLTLYTL